MKPPETKISIQFPGGYDRIGTIVIEINDCNVCRRDQLPCLVIDASEGEYIPGAICEDCVGALFLQNFFLEHPLHRD